MALITKLALPSASGLLELGKAGLKLVGGVRAAVFLTAALFFAASSNHYHKKVDSLEAQVASAVVQDTVDRANLKVAQEKVSIKVVTKYVDKVRIVHEKARVIREQIPVYVPSDLPVLPGSFRVFFDAAVKGELPDPAAVADAAPVAPEDVAATTADNAEISRLNNEKLVSLQEWVVDQQELQVEQVKVPKKRKWYRND